MNENNNSSRLDALLKAADKINPEIDEIAKRLCKIDDITIFIGAIAYIMDVWQYNKKIPDSIMDPVLRKYMNVVRGQLHAEYGWNKEEQEEREEEEDGTGAGDIWE